MQRCCFSKFICLLLVEKYWIKVKKQKKKKIIAPTRNDEFELPYGFYSVSDIQYYMEYIIKKT